jgi:uncharacterized membrane protein YgaE (UPF0421/DUF939 family)
VPARDALRAGLDRLSAGIWPATQTAVAAAIAWSVAHQVLGHDQPVFAAIAAVVALGTTRGERGRRAIELVGGILIGITIADLLLLAIPWTPVRLTVGALLAMSVALLLRGGSILTNQAAVWSILVATIPAPAGTLIPTRFFDGLVGVTTALIFSQLLFPIDPMAEVRRGAGPVTSALAEALDLLAKALAEGDRELAEHALRMARQLDEPVEAWRDAVEAAEEATRLAPPRRRERDRVRPIHDLVRQLDHAVRNTRVLARATRRLLREGGEVPEGLPVAVTRLAEATRAIERQLYSPVPVGSMMARTEALQAAVLATDALPSREDMAIGVVVGQIRSTAADLLQATGLDLAAAQQAIDEAEAGGRNGEQG